MLNPTPVGEVKIPPSTKHEVVHLNLEDALRALRQMMKPEPAPS